METSELLLVSELFEDKGFITKIIDKTVLVTLSTRSVTSIEILKVLIAEGLDEWYIVAFDYALKGAIITIA